MKVNEFLKSLTKDKEVAEYYSEIIIKTHLDTHIHHSLDGNERVLAQGKAYELLKIDNIKDKVHNLQGWTIVEIRRILQDGIPVYNCPYLLLVV